MENLYKILQSDPTASTEELRDAYKRLVRLCHPDKNIQITVINNEDDRDDTRRTTSATTEMFINVDRAWKILSDPQLRAQFDAKWHERVLAQDLPIQDIVSFEDFDHDETDEVYTYSCRCGGVYVLSEVDSQLHFDIVCCETCSLTIKVLYDVSQEQGQMRL